MTDKKLTDSEIIKTWNEEIHLANYVNENYRNGIEVSLIENTLDLINRIQAENKRLKAENEGKDFYLDVEKDSNKMFMQIMGQYDLSGDKKTYMIVDVADIDNLLKELVGKE